MTSDEGLFLYNMVSSSGIEMDLYFEIRAELLISNVVIYYFTEIVLRVDMTPKEEETNNLLKGNEGKSSPLVTHVACCSTTFCTSLQN